MTNDTLTNDKAAGRHFLQPIEGVSFPVAFCKSQLQRINLLKKPGQMELSAVDKISTGKSGATVTCTCSTLA
ncbi:MAG: hypothetical protein F6K14_07205 [Symploca sp. SIO2C1]|nr:hypothetical protein [Symploca sp. SIO2C1]